MLEKTLESSLDYKEIKPINLKGNQSWIFIGRTDAEAETPILWPPDVKTHWKRPWCWKRLKVGGEGDDRGWDGWMASSTWVWLDSRSGDGQGSLAAAVHEVTKNSTTERLKWTAAFDLYELLHYSRIGNLAFSASCQRGWVMYIVSRANFTNWIPETGAMCTVMLLPLQGTALRQFPPLSSLRCPE